MDSHSSADEVRRCIRTGNHARAAQILGEALSSFPDHPELLYLSGILDARRGDNLSALSAFSRALAFAPDNPALLFNRGLVLYRLERMQAAQFDFEALCALRPEDAAAWTNLGIIHQREGRAEPALDCFLMADRLSPGSPAILRMKANALREVDRHDEALKVHEDVVAASPGDPAALTDRALCLLSLGKFEQAFADYQNALTLAPGDQTALAGLYMSANELGRDDIALRLMDYSRLLSHGDMNISSAYLRDLRETALEFEHLVWEPAGRSTRAGKQSPVLSTGSPILDRLHELIAEQVGSHIQLVTRDPDLRGHPWVATVPRRWRLQSWITVLEQGGQQTPHIHPAGWLSGVFYVDEGAPADEGAGDLMFGKAPGDLPINRPAIEHRLRPAKGSFVMFPSFFFHNTIPYAGAGSRISIAFDVLPQ